MRKLLIFVLFLYTAVPAIAQKDKEIPGWGKIDKADLQLKECDFEKDAAALMLLETGELSYDRGITDVLSTRTDIRRRIKILKESGFSEADVKLSFYSDNGLERIVDLDAVTYNLDASGNIKESKVEKGNFFRQKKEEHYTTITFTFPDVKVGSILEFRYGLVRDAVTRIDPWVFQNDIPTRLSYFHASFPEYFKFFASQHSSQPVESKRSEDHRTLNLSGGTINFRTDEYFYKVRNLPAFKTEPYMGAGRDFIARVEFQLSQIDYPNMAPISLRKDWPQLAESLMDNAIFGQQIRRNFASGDQMKDIIRSGASPEEKIIQIYRHVQKKMVWNGVRDFYCENARQCWQKGVGTTGDINIILLNLLRDAEIEAYPILASTRSHGKLITAYPMLSQFNTLVVYAQAGEKVFILDASDKFNPPNLIPEDVLGTDAFLVDKEKAGFITLWDGRMTAKQMVSMLATVTPEGELKGEAAVSSFNYARNDRMNLAKDNKDKFISTFLATAEQPVKVTDLSFSNLDNDSFSLDQKFKFSVPVSSSGDYKYFNTHLFTGIEKNPFVSDKRQTDVDFGYNQYYLMAGSFSIPEDHVFEEVPKNTMMIMPDTSIVFRRIMDATGNKLSFRITLEFARPTYELQEYPELKDFYKKLYALLNEQVVFRKKAQPRPRP